MKNKTSCCTNVKTTFPRIYSANVRFTLATVYLPEEHLRQDALKIETLYILRSEKTAAAILCRQLVYSAQDDERMPGGQNKAHSAGGYKTRRIEKKRLKNPRTRLQKYDVA